MALPWTALLFAAATAVLNLNAQRSGEMMTRNPFVLLQRSKSPAWFRFNLIGRWAIVVVLLGLVVVAKAGLLPQAH